MITQLFKLSRTLTHLHRQRDHLSTSDFNNTLLSIEQDFLLFNKEFNNSHHQDPEIKEIIQEILVLIQSLKS